MINFGICKPAELLEAIDEWLHQTANCSDCLDSGKVDMRLDTEWQELDCSCQKNK